MLQKEALTDPTAIEKIVCEPFMKEIAPLTKKAADVLVTLILYKDDPNVEPLLKDVFLAVLIKKRLEVGHSFTLDNRSLILLAYLAESPGEAVLYIWYLQYICKKNGLNRVTLERLCSEIFPLGFPTKSSLEKIWDSQKVDCAGYSNNLVDHSSAGISLLP